MNIKIFIQNLLKKINKNLFPHEYTSRKYCNIFIAQYFYDDMICFENPHYVKDFIQTFKQNNRNRDILHDEKHFSKNSTNCLNYTNSNHPYQYGFPANVDGNTWGYSNTPVNQADTIKWMFLEENKWDGFHITTPVEKYHYLNIHDVLSYEYQQCYDGCGHDLCYQDIRINLFDVMNKYRTNKNGNNDEVFDGHFACEFSLSYE